LTALIEIVTLDGGKVVVTLEDVEVCVANIVVELRSVDTTVVVALRIPPNGENLSIVESGVL
jgi:hypothetical protein